MSDFGVTGFVVVLCFLCYFCFDKSLGRRIGFTVLFGLSLGCAVKDCLRFRRPIGAAGVRTLNPDSLKVAYSPDGYEYSYSMPSNHSLSAAATWSTLGFYLKGAAVWSCGLMLTLLAGLSRVYLGAHYPGDVLAGIVIGYLVAALTSVVTHYFWDAKLFYAAAALLFIACMRVSAPSEDTVKSVAALCGLIVGCWMDDMFVSYQVGKNSAGNIVALIGAVVVTSGVFLGLKQILPVSPMSDFVRYFAVCFVGSGPYPALVAFIRRFDWRSSNGTHA